MIEWWLDGLVGLMMLWLAWQALSATDLLRSVAMFVTFGLLVAIAWTRLGAPDVAIAEAAIGAGLTGALLLITIRRMEDQRKARASEKQDAQAD